MNEFKYFFIISIFLTSSRSLASVPISGNLSLTFWGRLYEKLFLRTGDSSGQSTSVGVPSKEKMVPSWSVSFLPGNSGCPLVSSAKMQPALQMSTGVA